MRHTERICALLSIAMLICGMPVNVLAEETILENTNDAPTEPVDKEIANDSGELLQAQNEEQEEDEPQKYNITLENCTLIDEEGNKLEVTEAEEGDVILLQYVPEDAERDEFIRWDVKTVSDVEVPVEEDSFTMPSEDVVVKANFDRFYTISVTDGTSNTEKAKKDESVTIDVRELNVDETFEGWTTNSEGVTFADETSVSTSFEMPENDVEIIANIKIIEDYTGFKTVDGNTYYYDKGTKVVGPTYIEEKKLTYFFDANGILKTGLQTYNGKTYYADKDGVLQTGWQKINNNWYYLGNDFIAKKGIQKIDGKYYYFNDKYIMQTGTQRPLSNNYIYLYNLYGVLQNSEGWHAVNNKWYYTDRNGAVKIGWQKIKNRWYFFNGNGEMQYGWQIINGKKYYLGKSDDGSMKYGWLLIDNKWYYLSSSNNDGSMKTGWQKINNVWYYMNANGVMQTGWQLINWGGGNKWFYFYPSGAMATGWAHDGKNWYYMNTSGVMQTGWLKKGNTWYFLKGYGAMAVGWLQLGDIWYYFKESGAMATGTLSINGKTYEFNSEGRWIDTAWLAKQSYPYYLKVNRALNCMTIYCKDYNGEYTIPYRAVTVSTGFPDTPTYLGHSVIDGKNRWYYFEEDEAYIAYACFFSQGRRMMHSIAYWEPRHDALVEGEFNKLGGIASHGCVRMTINNAKWIYYNCPNGTPVYVYEDWNNPGPLGKPYVRKITAWGTGWDPYDDEPGNPYNR